MCQGYYRHNTGYTPEWPGFDDFQGEVIHPQEWPDDVDLAGKRVVVIGSGATAATLIPTSPTTAPTSRCSSARPRSSSPGRNATSSPTRCAGSTSPTSGPTRSSAARSSRCRTLITETCLEQPEMARQFLIDAIRAALPEGFDVEKHFNPSYRPWQQRIAVVPDGDLFKAHREGPGLGRHRRDRDVHRARASSSASGEALEADVVDHRHRLRPERDGRRRLHGRRPAGRLRPTRVTYRGIMFTGVPNLAYVFGYFRASWTLRADLISDFVCRLLDAHGRARRHVDGRPDAARRRPA